LTVAPGVTEKSTPELFFFTTNVTDSADCTLEETATGVAPGASVDTGIVAIVDGEVVDGTSGPVVDFTLERGDEVELVVANVFTAADAGGGDGGGEGDNGGSGSGLPDTGASDAGALAQWALLALIVGAWVTVVARRA
jgi:hypothetical protein